jgi:cell division protein FtsL
MADYNRSEAYDLSLFEMPVIKGSAAPQINNAPKKEKTAVRKPKTVEQHRKESVSSALRALRLFLVSATLLLLFGSVLFSRISLVMLENKAAEITAQIDEAESENTRLVMALNSSVSIEKVDAYAVSVLGMRKLERYQVRYFENRDGDKVVLADGKAVSNEVEAAD